MLNDKEGSEKIMDKLKSMDNQVILSSSQTDLSCESYPLIFLSAEEENLGQIVNINQICASAFGYTKTELIGKKINTL